MKKNRVGQQSKRIRTSKIIPLLSLTFLLFCLLLISCGGGGGGGDSTPAPTPPPAFTTADLAGVSNIIGVSSGGTSQGTMSGTTVISSSGSVTGGSYTHSIGTTANLTGGSLSLTSQGILSGFTNTSVGVITTILYGKLNASKSFASFVSSTNFGEYDLVTVIKSGGTFSASDLQGTWHICEISSGGSVENVYHGTLNVGSGGSFSSPKGNGTVTINSAGSINGSATLIPSGFLTFQGTMDSTKEIAVYRTSYSTGEYSISIAVRESGLFSVSDLSGIWHFTLASSGTSEGISYGTIQLDAAGQVRGGYYRSTGGNVSLSGGSVSITSAGVLSGSINASDGTTFSIVYGKMNKSKNVISLVGPSSTGGRDFILAHRESS